MIVAQVAEHCIPCHACVTGNEKCHCERLYLLPSEFEVAGWLAAKAVAFRVHGEIGVHFTATIGRKCAYNGLDIGAFGIAVTFKDLYDAVIVAPYPVARLGIIPVSKNRSCRVVASELLYILIDMMSLGAAVATFNSSCVHVLIT